MSKRDHAPLKVLYFAGSGRSGTTLINAILGSMPGTFAAGELRYVWERGVVENHLCNCGRLFDSCPLWSQVVADVRADCADPDLDPAAIGRRLLRRLQVRRVPMMFLRRALGRPAVPGHRDDVALRALYHAVKERTGAELIVDSSKLPPYGMLLAQFCDLDVRVLHVVRDPRATAFSWLRRKKSLDHGDDGTLMPRQPIGKSAFLWLCWNLVTSFRWRSGEGKYLRVRYEDFVADPKRVMTQVCGLAQLNPAGLPFAGDHQVSINSGHVVAGNPNRHNRGLVTIEPDREWQQGLRRGQAIIVSLLTTPGLVYFGYPLSPRRSRRRQTRSAPRPR